MLVVGLSAVSGVTIRCSNAKRRIRCEQKALVQGRVQKVMNEVRSYQGYSVENRRDCHDSVTGRVPVPPDLCWRSIVVDGG